MKLLNPTSQLIDSIIKDAPVRRKITKESHLWFFHVYFPHYIKHESAPFQKEMFSISEDTESFMSVIVAFRGSGKSTIMTLSYPIWAILGKQQKKHVLLLSQTHKQVKQHLSNLKQEFESNELLRRDLGPFKETSGEWGFNGLDIPKHNARISIVSAEQSVRGARHGAHRPDLIICDDVEDLQSNKTKEGRDKTFQWFTSEIVPLGDESTKIIVVGNLLHEDSLLMKLRVGIEEDQLDGIFREYPLVNDEDEILWLSRFPDMESIQKERRKIVSESSWQREYMLKIISDEERVIHPDWIQRYSEIKESRPMEKVYISADLAVLTKDTADYTAIVLATVYGRGEDIRIYIDTQTMNKRMEFPECVDTIRMYANNFHPGKPREIIIETNSYQLAMAQQLEENGHFVHSVNNRSDKRARLSITADYIKSGKILFPLEGTERLIQQIVGFGKEKHDDLMDAFSMMIIRIIEENHTSKGFQGGLLNFRGGYWEKQKMIRRGSPLTIN